ncbi:unnamed protein product [Prunus armeniaca]|uniref:Uncharacterized protein n=1 Tax=Prunus armeniaca TaxID=36596 RepID=A0A6J5VRH9_PRUAR|nr:unnamed protein product [Prunus armeniaca]
MYYHEELAFTITINKGKCAGKATGDAGSIPACESKKTKRGGSPTGSEEPESIDFQVYLLDVILPMRVPSCFEYPNPSITCQSQRLEGPKAIPYLKEKQFLKKRKEKIDIAREGRSKCTFVTEVSREEITLNGLPVLLSPLQKGRSDSLIGEDLIKRPMASRIRSFI